MLCIHNTYTEAYFNIAAEEYFLKNSSDDIFLLYQNEPSVIIGKHQNPEAEINLEMVQKNKIKIVRRFSGGGSVFHDLGNLNITFIENNGSLNFDKYTRIIIDMLGELGLQVEPDERRALFLDGLKVSGSAQSIYKKRVLFHATLLFSTNLECLTSVLEGNPDALKNIADRKIYVKSVKSPVTNILGYIEAPINLKQIKEFIVDYMVKINPDSKIYQLSDKDISGIEELKEIKYETPIWNYDGKVINK